MTHWIPKKLRFKKSWPSNEHKIVLCNGNPNAEAKPRKDFQDYFHSSILSLSS